MAINDILDTGQRGMTTQRQALTTSSNNIANANTPGYSRQKAIIQTTPSNNINHLQIGSGAEVKQVVRIHDEFVQKQLIDEGQTLGSARVKSESLGRFEALTAKEGSQLSEQVNKFFNSFRELSANAENPTLRNVVHSSAKSLVAGFKQMDAALETGRQELDLRVGDVTDQINVYSKEIAGLNETIHLAEVRGENPNDLYDRRDGLLRDLSQKINVQVTEDQLHQKTVIAGGAVLVQGGDSHQLTVRRTAATDEKAGGSMTVFVMNSGQPREITKAVNNGELAGLIQARDKVINPAMKHLNEIAFSITNKVNAVHQQGIGLDGEGDRRLFKEIGKVENAANQFDLDDSIAKNHEKIATALEKGAPGDNRVALMIADLQNEKALPSTELGGSITQTFNESLNSLVANVGVETQRENQMFEHQRSVVDQLENYRESYSGVSLEEEAVEMMRYQTVFNASAKALKVGEELLQTILTLKD